MAPESNSFDPFIKAAQAAEYLDMSVQTIYNRVHRDDIPHYGSGATLRFKRSELDDWLKNEKQVKPTETKEPS